MHLFLLSSHPNKDFMGNKEVTTMLSQYLVNISRTSAKLLPQLEEGPSFQTEGPLTKKNGMPRLCRIRMSPVIRLKIR